MASFPVSSAFVGRAADLARLEAAARDPLVTAVLVSGEAGLGKSRLLSEFLARLDSETVVLTGRCPELGAQGVPFAPFLTVMRRLRPAGPPLLSGGEMLTELDRLSREHPVVLVVEDLHWADESSLDLFAFLIANLAHCGVLLVATHRPAGDGRLRGMLAELRRLPSVTAIELRPLTRHDVGRQLAALLGREPEPGFAGRVYERSEGYPLFVEALSNSSGETPADLRELLLAWMSGLPSDERAVLRAAAVAGSPAGHRLLAEVAGLPEQRVEDAIVALAAARLLVVHEAEYEFRHVLFRQAVYEDLLLAARTRLHARLTAVLLADPSLLPAETYAAELAQHATLAADWPTAINASWQAAEVAAQGAVAGGPGQFGAAEGCARPEQIRHLARIRELWDKIPDAAAELPVGRLELLERLAEACAQRGMIDPGLAAVDEALAMAGADSPYQVARLLLLRARLGNQASGGENDLRRALDLLATGSGAAPNPDAPNPDAPEPDAPVAALRGALLVELASVQMFSGDPAGAAASASAALDAVGRAGRHAALAARAHAMLGLAAADSDTAAAMAHFATARSVSPDPGTRLTVAIWESAMLVAAGQYETAIQVIRHGLRAAHETFQFVEKGPVLTVKWVQALTSLGRWPQALDLIEETLSGQVPPLSRAVLLLCYAKIKLAQGDPAAARASVLAAEPILCQAGRSGWASQYRLELAAITAELSDPDQPAGQRTDAFTDALTGADPRVDHHAMWPMLVLAARRAVELDEPGSGVDLRALAATLRCSTRPDAACRLSVTAAVTGQAEQWEQAARAWHELHQPFEHAQALLSAARAHIGTRDRARARTALQAALTIARELGARPLAEEAERTARRAGLNVAAESAFAAEGAADEPADTGNSFGLTARELDVLRLTAAGLSNRQIGSELFISSNTAGVHVSRILAKLGASTRTQAAAIARERNLVY
ncbi:MAG TPA: AAA family ATPase [Streptosporangiaceae bacterium]